MKVLTRDEFKELYGGFFERGAALELDAARIPEALHPLIPYASFWGEPDDEYRADLVRDAAEEIRRNLEFAVERHIGAIREWLSRAGSTPPSAEYVAFTNLLMAYNLP